MRVIHVIHNLDRAGAQKSLASLLRGLTQHDGEHTVFAWKRSGPVAAEIEAAGISVIEGPGRFLPAVAELRALARKHNADLIHAHMEDAANLARMVQVTSGIPYAVTFHDGTKLVPDLPPLKRRLRMATLKNCIHHANAVIGVRAELQTVVAEGLGIPKDRIQTLPACVALPEAADVEVAVAARKTYDGPIRVLAVARHVPLKRHDVLIDAIAELGRRNIPCTATILGDGPLLEQNRALAERLEGPARVHLPGATDDVAAHLARADVFVNTSKYEGTSMSILEAMSWQLPVVASDAPGNRELVISGQTGQLFPLDTPSRLADAILAAREVTPDTVGPAATLVERSFSADALARAHLTLYAEIVASTQKSSRAS